MDENQLGGTLPSELGLLTNLTGLSVGINSFTGTIPVELSQCVTLINLQLNQNRLTGPIPTGMHWKLVLVGCGVCWCSHQCTIPTSRQCLVLLRAGSVSYLDHLAAG